MAEACTVSLSIEPGRSPSHEVFKVTWDWTSGTGGNSGNVSANNSTDDYNYAGRTITSWIKGRDLKYAITNPDATAPSDNYDITVTTEESVDILGGTLGNRDTANTEMVFPKDTAGVSGTFLVTGALTMNVTNAGDTKKGKLIAVME